MNQMTSENQFPKKSSENLLSTQDGVNNKQARATGQVLTLVAEVVEHSVVSDWQAVASVASRNKNTSAKEIYSL